MQPFYCWLKLLKNGFLFLLMAVPSILKAQFNQSLTLKQAYELAEKNYPESRQKSLSHQIQDLNIQNLNTGYLPQVNLNGQASYQSDVTKISIPVPGVNIPELNKDQYKAYADVSQLLYDGLQ